jgi:hypothetical protein
MSLQNNSLACLTGRMTSMAFSLTRIESLGISFRFFLNKFADIHPKIFQDQRIIYATASDVRPGPQTSFL